MNNDDLFDALAAMAAGEAMPGADQDSVVSKLAADEDVRALLAELQEACGVLRASAPAACEDRRRAAVEAGEKRGSGVGGRDDVRLLRRPVAAAIAAVLFLAVATLIVVRLLAPPPGPSKREASPLNDLFATVAGVEPGKRFTAEDLRDADGQPTYLGGGGSRGDPLVAFARQVSFAVLVPRRLPPGFALVRARVVRARPPVLPIDLIWLDYRGPKTGILVVLVWAADDGNAEVVVNALPKRWNAARGTSVIVSSPSLDETAAKALLDSLRVVGN